jgi:hypothetical protein
MLTLTTSACNGGDKVRVIDTTRQYTVIATNIKAGRVITSSNLHFLQLGLVMNFFVVHQGR